MGAEFVVNDHWTARLTSNGWWVTQNGHVWSAREKWGDAILFSCAGKRNFQMYAAYRFLCDEFKDSPGLEQFIQPFRREADWRHLQVWADYLGDAGELEKELLLRQLLPKCVAGHL